MFASRSRLFVLCLLLIPGCSGGEIRVSVVDPKKSEVAKTAREKKSDSHNTPSVRGDEREENETEEIVKTQAAGTHATAGLLVGKWEAIGKDERVEFIADGTATWDRGIPIVAKWQILKDRRLKVEAASLGFSVGQVAELAFNGNDQLTISFPENSQKYKRVAEFTRRRSAEETQLARVSILECKLVSVDGELDGARQTFLLTNKSGKKIASVKGGIVVADQFGEHSNLGITIDDPLEAEQSREESGCWWVGTRLLKLMRAGRTTVKFRVDHVIYADGSRDDYR